MHSETCVRFFSLDSMPPFYFWFSIWVAIKTHLPVFYSAPDEILLSGFLFRDEILCDYL